MKPPPVDKSTKPQVSPGEILEIVPGSSRVGLDNKTAPSGGGNTDRSLTRSSGTSREGLPHMVDQPRPPLTPIQQLLLIRSIAGHVTADASPERAETALGTIRSTLDGRDPVAGDG